MASPIAVGETDFETQVLKAELPVLVDFWAPWCGPCRQVAPIVEELASEYAGRLSVTKINTDENPSIAINYGIRSIPTLMIFKGGRPVSTMVGFRPKSALKKEIDAVLG